MANDQDYVDLGRACGDVCQVLHRRLKGKRLDGLNQSILDAIGELTGWVRPVMRTESDPLTGVSIAGR
jgi:hypothetical protein